MDQVTATGQEMNDLEILELDHQDLYSAIGTAWIAYRDAYFEHKVAEIEGYEAKIEAAQKDKLKKEQALWLALSKLNEIERSGDRGNQISPIDVTREENP